MPSRHVALLALFIAIAPFHMAYAHGDQGGEPTAESALPLADLHERAASYHDQHVKVEGLVAWAACDGMCMLQLVPEAEGGRELLVRTHGELPAPANELLGDRVRVEGTFYRKVYPAYRMRAWRAAGWREGEGALPEASLVYRLSAERISMVEHVAEPASADPLEPWTTHRYPLEVMEFERGGTAVGRKCLEPGGETPSHSTGGIQEVIVVLSGSLSVTREDLDKPLTLTAADATIISPATRHAVRNSSDAEACYLFFTAEPAAE